MEEQQQEKSEEQLAEELLAILGPTPKTDEKQNVHSFLREVVTTKDTTKVGFLTVEELGVMPQTVRSYRELSLIGTKIIGSDAIGNYFAEKAEILLATSLSREGKLISLAVVTRKEVGDVTRHRKQNRGWFGRKEEEPKLEA